MGVSAPVAKKRKRKAVPNAYQIALELGVAYETARQWLRLDMPPEKGPARDAWVDARKASNKSRAIGSEGRKGKGGGGEDDSLVAQKVAAEIAVLKERRMALRLERRRRKGELVERQAVERAWKRKVTEAKVQIESIPALAGQFVPEGDARNVVVEEITKVIHRALKGLARGKSADA